MKVEPEDLRLDSGLGPKDRIGLNSRLDPKDLGLDLDLTEVTCVHLWLYGKRLQKSSPIYSGDFERAKEKQCTRIIATATYPTKTR